jgi:hypothetical protein
MRLGQIYPEVQERRAIDFSDGVEGIHQDTVKGKNDHQRFLRTTPLLLLIRAAQDLQSCLYWALCFTFSVGAGGKRRNLLTRITK